MSSDFTDVFCYSQIDQTFHKCKHCYIYSQTKECAFTNRSPFVNSYLWIFFYFPDMTSFTNAILFKRTFSAAYQLIVKFNCKLWISANHINVNSRLWLNVTTLSTLWPQSCCSSIHSIQQFPTWTLNGPIQSEIRFVSTFNFFKSSTEMWNDRMMIDT